jgi:succinate-acetate transporter protein
MEMTREPVTTGNGHGNGHGDRAFSPGVFLQPIAPPVTLGLWGFFGSTMVLSTWLLHWWGNPTSAAFFFVFNAAFGGVAQFLAGIWSFKARDYVASALLTMWGTYWMAWGLLHGLAAAGALTIPPVTVPQPAFAIWVIPLGLATLCGALAALSPRHGNFPLFVLLFTVGAGCACLCGGLWTASTTWVDAAAWLFIVGACAAWYVGAMTMLESAWRRVILPLGKFGNRDSSIPGRKLELVSEYVAGQPGVRQGQA